MERFDLEVNTANLINEFDKASFNGTISILEWFYKTINYKGIFESDFSDTIYKRLISNGYTEITNPIEELESFKRLMGSSNNSDAEKVGYTLIALILKCIKDHAALTPSLEQFVALYNEIYNKENTFSHMMELLTESIGKEVVFVIIRECKIELLTGKLEGVEEYHSVTINGEKYPFIGYNVEINKITNSDGTVLYNNNLASSADLLVDYGTIEKKNKDLFGNRYNKELKKVC